MHEPDTSGADRQRSARRCPNCGNDLDSTGAGSDELLECAHCGLVMFDQRTRS